MSVGGSIIEELLVGMQQAFEADEISVVVVVEGRWRGDVQRRQSVVATVAGAVGPCAGSERRVYVGLVVDPVPECGAPCLTYCVGSYTQNYMNQRKKCNQM